MFDKKEKKKYKRNIKKWERIFIQIENKLIELGYIDKDGKWKEKTD